MNWNLSEIWAQESWSAFVLISSYFLLNLYRKAKSMFSYVFFTIQNKLSQYFPKVCGV